MLLAFLYAVQLHAQPATDGESAIDSVEIPVQPAELPIPLWLGFGIGSTYSVHSTDGRLQCLNDPACPVYTGGNGSGFLAAFSADWRPVGKKLGLLGRLGIWINSITMSTVDDRARTLDQNGSIVPLIRSHDMNASLTALRLDLAAQYRFGKIRAFAGPAFGLLLSPSWNSTSTLLAPGNVTFANQRRDTTFLPEQTIAGNSAFQTDFMAGIGYELPLGKKLLFAPELHAALPLTSIVNNASWKQTSIALLASIRWGTGIVKEEEFRQEYKIDTIQVKRPSITGNHFVSGNPIRSVEISETEDKKLTYELTRRTDTLILGSEPPKPPVAQINLYAGQAENRQPVRELRLKGQFVTEGFPILPFVFFKPQSADFADRYHRVQNASEFSSDSLEPTSIVQHRDILNIIGERLKQRPRARITLKGTADPTTENADCDLAQSRAAAVRDYLVTVWQIEEKRIQIEKPRRKCAPESPTMSQSEAGYEENRHVEIDSEDDNILAPVLRTRYIQLTEFTPQSLEADPAGSSAQAGVKNWSLDITYKDRSLFSDKGNSPIPQPRAYALTADMVRPMHMGEAGRIQASFTVQDKNGLSASDIMDIPIVRDTTSFAVQRLSLMHFGVLQDKLNKAARSSIKRFVKNLEADATISVVGYSDNLGDIELNNRLAQSRAQAVSEHIRKVKPSANIVQIDGVGSAKMPPGISNHDLPESRFLSRTVQIEILRSWKTDSVPAPEDSDSDESENP